jgi:hypothetical protein
MKVMSCLIVSVVIMMAATSAKSQQQANVKGTWKMNVETSVGSGTPVFELKHDTEKTLSGTYKGQLGESTVKGTVQGNKIHLEFEINGSLIEYDGSVEGDTMKGKVKLGSIGEGTFTGARKK